MPNGSLPGAKYTLYVEDEITRRYLNALESNRKLVDVRVVGGCERVIGCLEDDFRSGVNNTFGIVDRDFDRQAKSGWCSTGAGMPFFCLPAHEIENYLLDFDIIAKFRCPGIDPQKPASHWQSIARTIAEGYLYSIVYNQILADVRREYLADYPSHLKLSSSPARGYTASLAGEKIASEAELVNKLKTNDWLSTAANRSGRLFAPEALEQRVSEDIAYYRGLLGGADWVRAFPGKEMFRAITNSMSMSDVQWLDLARFVAEIQREQSKVPQDIEDVLCKFV